MEAQPITTSLPEMSNWMACLYSNLSGQSALISKVLSCLRDRAALRDDLVNHCPTKYLTYVTYIIITIIL